MEGVLPFRGSNDEIYAGYTYEDMNRFRFMVSTYSETHPNNLAGPIHPIFRSENWHNVDFYEIMVPVFRLASNILQSPPSFLFLYNLFYAERKVLPELSKQLEREASQIDRIKDVPLSQVFTRIVELMDRLADCIEFRWLEPYDPRAVHGQVAFCLKNPHLEAYMEGSARNSTGNNSRIYVRDIMVRKLAELRNLQGVGGTPSHILRLQFMMAVAMCHEVVHACNNSIVSARGMAEPFFENERIAELGHAWESAVFGGTWSPLEDLSGTLPLLVGDWPGFERRATPSSLERAPPQPYQTKYFIPMDWITRIQQADQWLPSADDAQYYTDLLKIPKTLGFREVYPGDDFDRNWKHDDELNPSIDDRGRVMRLPLYSYGESAMQANSAGPGS